MRVAFGLKAHSGWSALVVVGICDGEIQVIDRRRIELVDAADAASAKQPYHAAVRLDGSEDLPAALTEAAGGKIDVVIDPLFGKPFVAALNAASFGARIVQLGASAGAEATLASATVRGKLLVIMGHTYFLAPPEIRREGYRRLSEAAAAGELQIETELIALEQVAEAWERLAAGAHRKIVLVP